MIQFDEGRQYPFVISEFEDGKLSPHAFAMPDVKLVRREIRTFACAGTNLMGETIFHDPVGNLWLAMTEQNARQCCFEGGIERYDNRKETARYAGFYMDHLIGVLKEPAISSDYALYQFIQRDLAAIEEAIVRRNWGIVRMNGTANFIRSF